MIEIEAVILTFYIAIFAATFTVIVLFRGKKSTMRFMIDWFTGVLASMAFTLLVVATFRMTTGHTDLLDTA